VAYIETRNLTTAYLLRTDVGAVRRRDQQILQLPLMWDQMAVAFAKGGSVRYGQRGVADGLLVQIRRRVRGHHVCVGGGAGGDHLEGKGGLGGCWGHRWRWSSMSKGGQGAAVSGGGGATPIAKAMSFAGVAVASGEVREARCSQQGLWADGRRQHTCDI